ncbi:PqiB family protein [Enterovibrio paralichthyis]|uniref:PqiB family protein n=1 Tax=Enterovibrio paralichthyis TaxID=2853805 RepID=UPI001C43C103|nr:MlaD family protein [Enterovibrio paralichthyis]MBV7296868.1 MCE family protein [Enterovibrio paralichthyis]
MSNVEDPKIKDPVMKKDKSLSPLWIFTLLAFVLAGWLLYKSVNEAGERIEIYFTDAQGIEAGRTTIRYQGLEVGIIRKVTLSDDLKSISAQAEIYPEATKILRQNTEFWVVRPRASITGISGLDALVSGNYIAVQPGSGDPRTTFIAADEPPVNAFGNEGLAIQLKSPDLGSLSVGSGVYFKKIRVGEVVDYRLTADNNAVTLSLNIKKEHAGLVKQTTKFWNVSGVKAEIGLSGVDVNIENLASVIAGGIAFDSPKDAEPAKPLEEFDLYPSINDTDRGIAITLDLPANHGITNPHAPIMYQGLEIGQLNGIHFNSDFTATVASANINPSMAWMLTSGSEFVIEQPEISLSGVKRLSNVITGNTLSIVPGKGDETRQFEATTTSELMAQNPESLPVTLTADSTWGFKAGTKVLYRGVQVGVLTETNLDANGVTMKLVIYPDYKHLVKSDSRFFALGGVSGQISAEGVEFSVPAVAQMIEPAISFSSEGQSKVLPTYPLFKSEIQARNAENATVGFKRYVLVAKKLPSVSEGSPVMYKNFTVGKVESFELSKGKVEVTVQVENRYQHLVTPSTVFWNQSGIDIKASLSGVVIDTGSMKSIIAGGISFGDIKGIENREGSDWKLYDSLAEAQNAGVPLTFTADDASGLTVGSGIRFQGVNVGEVTALSPAFKRDGVTIKAIIYPEFADQLAKATSYFWVAQPSLSLTKTENLDSLFGSYISVVPGKGAKRQEFHLHKSAEYSGGLTLVLESESRGSVSVGTPILFRDFEVGSVTDVSLGRFADRVLIEVKISDDYKHLVRNNTVFWNQSGVDVSIGITGAKIQSGTLESILKGGISFATPPGESLAKPARSDQHFLLHNAPQEQWTTWRTAIPSF